MIELEEILHIHKTLIDIFGGAQGVRDLSALKSALARPFQTFEKKDLHPAPIYKAAALIESILINHPFIDGNKRIGYVAMRSFLISCGFDIKATQDEKYHFVIDIASGKIRLEEIIKWLANHVTDQENIS
jgi:death on curing protein